MEILKAEPLLEQSKIDLNEIVNLIINHITESVSRNILFSIKEMLETNFPKPEEKTEYYTQKEVMERLKISRSTLFQREKKGIIDRDGCSGRKPLYSKNQIENLLNTYQYTDK